MSAPPKLLVRDWQVGRRWRAMALAVAGAAALAGSYFLPYWNFHLVAPQYPQGLDLIVSLTGVTGDVGEIDIINHYIGMSHLADAAQVERAYGGWAVALLALALVTAMIGTGRRFGWTTAVLGLMLPVGFLVDTFYWLYRFGHVLDPKAAVHIAPFTPTLFGSGKIGQFHTTATPAIGFGLAMMGVVLLGIAVWQRWRVCRVCPAHDRCAATCTHGFLGVPK